MKTVTEDDLVLLLREAASSYDVPADGPGRVLAAVHEQSAGRGGGSGEGRRSGGGGSTWRPWLLAAAASVLVVLAGGVALSALPDGPLSALSTLPGGRPEAAPAAGSAASDGADQQAEQFSTTSSASRAEGLSLESGRQSLGDAADSSTKSGTDRLLAPVPAAAPRAAAPGAAAQGTPPVAAKGGPAAAAPAPDGAAGRVVKTGEIALVVPDGRVTPTLTAVQRAAKAQGGYVSASSTEESGDTPSGRVTLRVPVARFEELVAAVRGLDVTVRSAVVAGRDVTAQFADVEAQLRTLKATRERFLLILGRTRTIGEVLTVKQRVDAVTAQIDRLEGERKVLAGQSELSTLEVSVAQTGDPAVRAGDRPAGGLGQAFRDAGTGFVTGVEALVRHSGRAALLLLCLAAVAALARLAWRLGRRRLV